MKTRIKKIKKRKISYRIGNLEWIEVPNDWRKCEGIVASRYETNAGLAERNYSIKCERGSEPLMVVEGFWIWWCYTHNHPISWCERERLKIEFCNKLEQIKEEIEQ